MPVTAIYQQEGYKRGEVVGKGAFGEAAIIYRLSDGHRFISKEVNLDALDGVKSVFASYCFRYHARKLLCYGSLALKIVSRMCLHVCLERDREGALREAMLLSQMDHTNIVKYVDSFQHKPVLFIVYVPFLFVVVLVNKRGS